MLDDMLVIVMRVGMTTAEKTMLEFGHPDQIHQSRQFFENEMTGPLTTSKMEELTGCKILTYQSQVMFDRDVIVEMFVFDCCGQQRRQRGSRRRPTSRRGPWARYRRGRA